MQLERQPVTPPARWIARRRGSRNKVRGCVRYLAASVLLTALSWGHPAAAGTFDTGIAAFARQDYVRSASIFVRRAERGEPAARTYLGYMYATGRGVPQDYVMAVQWLHRAADQGFPTAQFLLGLMYDKGHGVRQDFIEAEVWLNLAAAHADRGQRDYWAHVRDAVAGKLTLAERDDAQRRAFEWSPISER